MNTMTNRSLDNLHAAVRAAVDDGHSAVEVLDAVSRAIFHDPADQPADQLEAALRHSLDRVVSRAPYYTLKASDVHKATIHAWGRTWHVADFLGRVLPGDVGKRVYRVSNEAGDYQFLQVENDSQFRQRTGRRCAVCSGLLVPSDTLPGAYYHDNDDDDTHAPALEVPSGE